MSLQDDQRIPLEPISEITFFLSPQMRSLITFHLQTFPLSRAELLVACYVTVGPSLYVLPAGRPSVHPPIRPSVRLSVCPSVHPTQMVITLFIFYKNLVYKNIRP